MKRLADRGLLRRERSKTDKRSMVAFLTKAGEQVGEEMYNSMRRAQDRLLSPLQPAYRPAFMAMLAELIEGNSKYSLSISGADVQKYSQQNGDHRER